MDVDGGSSTASGETAQTPPAPQQQQPQQPEAILQPLPDPANVADIDMSFLLQFSCLGTTDHDELIQQLQKIMGNQLTDATARFFLDMNNW